jgi:hypothetical protein
MRYKLAVTILAGILPFIALGDATNQPTQSLRLKVTCRSGAVVILDNAALVERGTKKDGAIPSSTIGTDLTSVRLEMPDAGTVTILWEDIEKIVVKEQVASENAYPIEIKLKNIAEAKTGKTYGPDSTIVGRSDVGEFTIQLKDVTEIVTLPAVGKI